MNGCVCGRGGVHLMWVCIHINSTLIVCVCVCVCAGRGQSGRGGGAWGGRGEGGGGQCLSPSTPKIVCE